MGFFNLLASDSTISFLGQTFDVSLNWLGNLIRILIEGIGAVGVGIIVFSIILKVVVLPFDVYQRISMRKQNIKMKENKDKLEKLQKQYANDKQMYNQKMMEMYKANGISMFSSCLPMIISLVVFFVAINAFNGFSQYANLQNYNMMANAYNASIVPYAAEVSADNVSVVKTDSTGADLAEKDWRIRVKDETSAGKYIYYTLVYDSSYAEKDYEYIKNTKQSDRNYFVDTEKTYAAFTAEIDALIEAGKDAENPENSLTKEAACADYFMGIAQNNVVKAYEEEVSGRMSFFWIKNIWVTDASYKHPVLTYNEFKTDASRDSFRVNGDKIKFNGIGDYTDVYTEQSYNIVTAKLSAQKNAANGYYVLIVLSIGTILLQQFVSMKSQKEQTQFSSVDGQGKSTQKMTLVIMTVMFAVFAFMYSASFSIYMITSNLLSLITTLIINKVVDVVMSKKEEAALQAQYNKRFPGRTYVSEKERAKKDQNKSDKKGGK